MAGGTFDSGPVIAGDGSGVGPAGGVAGAAAGACESDAGGEAGVCASAIDAMANKQLAAKEHVLCKRNLPNLW